MQTRNRIFDDAARLAGGALGTLEGIRREIEALVRQQVERALLKFDLVSRDEFEAVKAMVARTRADNERITIRLEKLEAIQTDSVPKKKTPTRKSPIIKKTNAK